MVATSITSSAFELREKRRRSSLLEWIEQLEDDQQRTQTIMMLHDDDVDDDDDDVVEHYSQETNQRRKSKANKSVSFSHVTIATYCVRPDYQPTPGGAGGAASDGTGSSSSSSPAMTMDRLLSTRGPLNIDLYEFSRAPLRRHEKDLKLNGLARESFFKECGYSRTELQDIVSEERKFYLEYTMCGNGGSTAIKTMGASSKTLCAVYDRFVTPKNKKIVVTSAAGSSKKMTSSSSSSKKHFTSSLKQVKAIIA